MTPNLREIEDILKKCFPRGAWLVPETPDKDYLPQELVVGTRNNTILFMQAPEGLPTYVVFWATPIGVRDYCIVETESDIIGWASSVWATLAEQAEDTFLNWLHPQMDKEVTPDLKDAYKALFALGVEFPGYLIEKLVPKLNLGIAHLQVKGKHYFQVQGTEALTLQALELDSGYDFEQGHYTLACDYNIGIPGRPRIAGQDVRIEVKGNTAAAGKLALTALYIHLVWTEYLGSPKEKQA